jgi:hypothetical protein
MADMMREETAIAQVVLLSVWYRPSSGCHKQFRSIVTDVGAGCARWERSSGHRGACAYGCPSSVIVSRFRDQTYGGQTEILVSHRSLMS